MSFRALLADRTDDGITVSVTDYAPEDLDDGGVTVAVDFSAVNYKDALALTGQGGVLRRFPIIPGIDFAGTVQQSDDSALAAGDRVVLNGWGVGEGHDGGFAQIARCPADWLVPLPDALSTRQAMAIGTAGYAAMLAVLALERLGVEPGDGEILVTGASGGVGSVSIALLSKLGYQVVASTGREDETPYLQELGADTVIARDSLSEPSSRPMGKERYAGVIDSVGSHTLVNALGQIRRGGVACACGLAQGFDLPGTVLPFILRGVTLAGIDSVYAPKDRRVEAWRRLATDLDVSKLDRMTSVVGLDAVVPLAPRLLAGHVRGRTVVDVNN